MPGTIMHYVRKITSEFLYMIILDLLIYNMKKHCSRVAPKFDWFLNLFGLLMSYLSSAITRSM